MTSPSPMTSLIEKISGELLVCRACRQSLKAPKSLACRHSFCEDCLYDMLSNSTDRHRVTCPACRTLSVLPPGGVRRLPDDPMVARLNDVIERRRKSTSGIDGVVDASKDGGRKLCDICSHSSGEGDIFGVRHKMAQYRCLECFKLLCSGCARLHRRTKVTSDHSLFDLDAVTSSCCHFHDNEPVRFYCDQCDVSVCVLCTYGEHAGHSVTSFGEAVACRRESIASLADECRHELDLNRRRLENIERTESEIRQAENAISDAALETISYIRSRERELLAALRTVVHQRHHQVDIANTTADISTSKSTLADTVRRLSELCRAAECLLSDVDRGGAAAAFLVARRQLFENMTSLLEQQRHQREIGECYPEQNSTALPPLEGSPCVQFIPFGIKSAMSILLGRLSVEDNSTDVGEKRSPWQRRPCSENGGNSTSSCDSAVSPDEVGDTFEELIVVRKRKRIRATGSDLQSRESPVVDDVIEKSAAGCHSGGYSLMSATSLSCLGRPSTGNSVETQTEGSPDPMTSSPLKCCDAATTSNSSTSDQMKTQPSDVECGTVRSSVPDVGTGHVDPGGTLSRMVTRRVQTECVVIRDSATETRNCPTHDKSTTCYGSSWCPVTVDRSTMTSVVFRDPRNDRSTSTDWLVITREQETSTTPPASVSSGTQADRPRTRDRAVDVRPETSNKSTSTSRPVEVIETTPNEAERRWSAVLVDVAVGDDEEMDLTVDCVRFNELRDDVKQFARNLSTQFESVDSSIGVDDENHPPHEGNVVMADERLLPNTQIRVEELEHASSDATDSATDSPRVGDTTTGRADIQAAVVQSQSLRVGHEGKKDSNLLTRLIELLPEIVKTAEVLTASHFSSGLTSRMLFEVADIARQIQRSSASQCGMKKLQDLTAGEDNIRLTVADGTSGKDDVDNSSSTHRKKTIDCAVGDDFASVVDIATGNDQPATMNRASGSDSDQRRPTVDRGVGDSSAITLEQSTMAGTTRPKTFDKETLTVRGHAMHKNVGTDSQSTADKQTSTSVVDVAAVYLGSASMMSMTRRSVTVSRGTCTPPLRQLLQQLDELTAAGASRTDRASSPIPISRSDKSVSASRGEALEPLDTFQTTSSPSSSPRGRRPLALSPRSKLACISEAASDDELGAGNGAVSDQDSMTSPTLLPPLSSINSRIVAARSLNRGGATAPASTPIRCGVTSLPRPVLGRQRPSLPHQSSLRVPIIAAIPPLSRSVFDFENVISSAAAAKAAASNAVPPTTVSRRSAVNGTALGYQRRSIRTKSTSLPDFSVFHTLMPPIEHYQLPQQPALSAATSCDPLSSSTHVALPGEWKQNS